MKKSTCLAGALALGLVLPAAGLGASLIAATTANAQQNACGRRSFAVFWCLHTGSPALKRVHPDERLLSTVIDESLLFRPILLVHFTHAHNPPSVSLLSKELRLCACGLEGRERVA